MSELLTIDEVLDWYIKARESFRISLPTYETRDKEYLESKLGHEIHEAKKQAKAHLERLIAAERLDESKRWQTIVTHDKFFSAEAKHRIAQLTHQANGETV